MKATTQNISAVTLTFLKEDIASETDASLSKLKEAVSTLYISRINIPVECYLEYYDSGAYKLIRDNTDQKTKTKFYITVDKMNGKTLEKINYYFDTPTIY